MRNMEAGQVTSTGFMRAIRWCSPAVVFQLQQEGASKAAPSSSLAKVWQYWDGKGFGCGANVDAMIGPVLFRCGVRQEERCQKEMSQLSRCLRQADAMTKCIATNCSQINCAWGKWPQALPHCTRATMSLLAGDTAPLAEGMHPVQVARGLVMSRLDVQYMTAALPCTISMA